MEIKNRIWKIISILCGVLAVGSVFAIYAGDSALYQQRRISFSDHEGEILQGTLYLGREKDLGIILLEGFGSDQVTLRSAANEFAKIGLTVFTFDFSGHGRSPGGLDFNNAETDRLARQALAAKEEFKRITGITDDRIILMGHSLGARVALQAASMDDSPPAGIILLGAQVNLSTNLQSEFFTGISDNSLPWVQDLGPDKPRTNVLLISGEWDDILTPEAAQTLFTRLSGEDTETTNHSGILTEKNRRELVILDRLVHNFEVFSSRTLSYALNWTVDQFQIETSQQIAMTASRRICFLLYWLY